ncbi:MAG: ABC transporter permease [Magnetospirillum sp.]|nr:ABC transporter permease [Magnetospirillum sp.]
MRTVFVLAVREFRDGFRNKWVVATAALLAALALTLSFVGNAPTGELAADPLELLVVGLSSLTTFLVPLIALLLSYDAVVGEHERGTLLLLLAYPVVRWQVLLGKFAGHVAILALATAAGYGSAGAVLGFKHGFAALAGWGAFAALIGTSTLLGVAFLALGYLISTSVRERGAAAGLAVTAWLLLVVIFDLALLGVLVADQGKHLSGSVVGALILFNPADAYRVLNLTGSDKIQLLSGLVGLDPGARPSAAALATALSAWALVPLAAACLRFSRRPI